MRTVPHRFTSGRISWRLAWLAIAAHLLLGFASWHHQAAMLAAGERWHDVCIASSATPQAVAEYRAFLSQFSSDDKVIAQLDDRCSICALAALPLLPASSLAVAAPHTPQQRVFARAPTDAPVADSRRRLPPSRAPPIA